MNITDYLIVAYGWPSILIVLVAAHFLLDYPLQGDFLSKAKNAFKPLAGVPWGQAMGAHVFLHAAAVFMVTSSYVFFFTELIAHYFLDMSKCRGDISYNKDQACHLLWKLIYFLILILAAYLGLRVY